MARTKTKMAVLVGLGTMLVVGTANVAMKELQAHRTYPGLAGVWEGTYFTQSVALKIARTNGTYCATFDYIDSGMSVPASDLKVGKNAISFHTAGTTERFAASIDSGMTQMSGNWRVGTNIYPIALKRTANPDITASPGLTDYSARSGSDLPGYWRATINSGPWHFVATLKIAERTNGEYRAEFESVDWGGEHIPANSITRDGNAIKIGFRLLGNFEGKLDAAAGQLAGNWTRGDKLDPVTFTRVDPQAEEESKNYVPASPAELQGHWKGTLDLPDGRLHFVFHVAKMPDGSFSATMDNPDQGANNIPATTTRYTPPHVSILCFGIGGVFNGALKNGKLTGTWRQQGAVHPLTLIRD